MTAPGIRATVDQGSTIPQKTARSLVPPWYRHVHIVDKTAATTATTIMTAEARRLGWLLLAFMFRV
jgi:hypothetical protein